MTNADGIADNVNIHIQQWAYDASISTQQFKLEQKQNGNWAIKSVSNGRYLEIFKAASRARIYACESYFRAEPMQEWWITFTGAGLM